MAFTFDQIFAADPSNPSNIAQNAVVTIFAPGDTAMTPLTITDPDGQPLANPITVNANGFGPAFAHDALDRVAWAGGGFTGFLTSYEGIKNEAISARTAAEGAASSAATAALANIESRIAAGEFDGAPGADGLNGANVLPTSEAVGQALTTAGVAQTALNAAVELEARKRAAKIHITVGKTSDCDFYTANYASDDLALQAAMDSLPAGYSGGGSILIKRGTYLFVNGTDASTKPNVHIEGEGMSTIIAWKNANTFAVATAATNWLITIQSYSSVSKLQLVGNSTYGCPVNGVNTYNPGSGSNILGGGLRVKDGSRVWLRHIFVAGMAEDGVTLVGQSGASAHANRIEQLYVIGCGGIGVNNGAYTYDTIFNGVWVGSCRQGMYINDGGVGVELGHVWGSAEHGVVVNGSSTRFSNCYIESNGKDGITATGAHKLTVTNSDFWQNGTQASSLGLSAGLRLVNSRNNSVTNNQFRDSVGYGVLMSGSNGGHNIVSGNVWTDAVAANPDTGALITYTGGVATAASTTVTDAVNSPFKQSHVGRWMTITGAGTAGASLRTLITGYVSATQVTVADPIVTTVNPATFSIRSTLTGIQDSTSVGRNIFADNQMPTTAWIVSGITTGANSSVKNNVGVNPNATSVLGSVSSGSVALDVRIADTVTATLAANTTISTFGTPVHGHRIAVALTQDSGGSKTATWPANFKFSGSAPALTATAAKTDVFEFLYDGTNWRETNRSMNT